MSLACQFEQFTSSYTLGELSRDVFIDAKLRIPEMIPKIDNIIGGDFQSGTPVVSVNDNLLVVSGVIYPQLIYASAGVNELSANHHRPLPEDYSENNSDHENCDDTYSPPREPQEYNCNWSGDDGILYEERIEIPGLQVNSVVEVKIIPKACDFEKSGADQINFTAKLMILIRPTNHRQTTVITELPVPLQEKVTVTKERITTEHVSAVKNITIPVRASLLLPNLKPGVARILRSGTQVSSLNWEYSRGKIYLKGLLDVNLLYIGRDDADLPTAVLVNEWNRESGHAVPFETYFETELPEEGILVVPSATPVETHLEIKSHRELHCQISLDCQVVISLVHFHEIATEAVSRPGTIIDTQKALFNFEEYLGEASGEISFELSADLPAGQPGAERLLTCQGQLLEPKVEVTEGNAAVEGGLDLWLLYTADSADGSRLYMGRWESRFNNNLPVAGMIEFPNLQPGAFLRTQMTLESLKPELVNDRTFKISGQIKMRILARVSRTLFILEDCAEVIPVNPETRPSMLFYIVQPGDTLWKIARRYQTTVAQLVQINQICNPDRIEVGQKLLIPK